LKCKNCSNELTDVEEFAHLADHGREEGLCNKCNREKKEFGGNTIPEGLDTGHKWNIRACSHGCGQLITWDAKFKTDSGISIPLDVKTRQPHNCPKNPYKGSTITKPIQYTKIDTQSSDKEPEKLKQIEIAEKLFYDLKRIEEKDDPIIDEIKTGQEEKNHAILYYEHEQEPPPLLQPLDKLSGQLDPRILQGLKNYGFGKGVLQFQERSFNAILTGDNTVISAPTGSGKTEAFTVPIIQKICDKNYPKGVFALLVYPLRALARDQIVKIGKLIRDCNLENEIEAFWMLGEMDSKTVSDRIETTKKKSVIIATTFDFINTHLTLVDQKWRTLCRSARVIVIDELHSYTSFHGSNVYHLIKRMKERMNDLQFIGSSATLHNAQEFFESICGLDPLSSRHVESKTGRERDVHKFFIYPLNYPQRVIMQEIAKTCYKKQSDHKDPDKRSRQLVFSNTHRDAEFVAENIERSSSMKINVHRGGLAQSNRTVTEISLREGDIDGISCTSTLELGIDIGTVDVAISSFQSNHDTFTQRSGRAGRKGKKSYTFCVFDPKDASCHYYTRNMLKYVNQIHEINISKDNPIISAKHEEAANIEKECIADPFWWKDNAKKWRFFDFLDTMSIRGSAGKVIILLNGKKFGERVVPVGYYHLHQNAIYHHEKSVYKVKSLVKTPTGAKANLEQSNDGNKATRPIVKVVLTKSLAPGVKHGVIELYRIITGYYKGDYNQPAETWEMHEGVEEENWVDFKWLSSHMAYKIELPSQFVPKNLQGKEDPGIHTIIHVFENAAQIVTKCEAVDIEAHYDSGSIYLYDNTNDGANGYSQMIREKSERIWETCRELLKNCECDKGEKPELGGCPKCTFTTGFCQTLNRELDKKKAREFFGVL